LHPTELPQKNLQIQFRQTANFSEEFADWLEWMTEPSLSQRYKSTEEAIKALQNPVPRQNTISLSKQKKKKPPGSKIKLYKDIDGLEIVIPPQGFRLAQIALISLISPFAIGFNLLFSFRQAFNNLPISDSAYLMKQIVQAFGIMFILLIIVWALFKRTRLKISQSSVSYIYEVIGIKWKFRQKIIIRNKYQLGLTHPNPQEICHQYTHLSLEELQWLAQEISDYLDIPISRI
jgi:hypothetical protein